MSRLRCFLFVTALGLAASPSAAAESDAELWTTLTANFTLADRWTGQADLVARFGEDDGGLYETRYGVFVGYKVGSRITFSVGYTRLHRYANGTTRTEERPRQQIAVDFGKMLGAATSGRVRLEQRIRRGGGVGWRLRPQVRAAWPLLASGAAVVLSHETFVALNDTGSGQRAGYERMRNFAGMVVPVTKTVKAEIGYLNQYDFGRSRPDAIAHIGSFGLTASW